MALLDNLEVKATGSMDDALGKLDEMLEKVKSLPKSRTVNLKLNTTNTTTEIKNVSENVKRTVKEIEKGAKQINSSISKTAKHTTGKLAEMFSSIKRIAYYRLIRSAIKAVTQGFQEGINNAYQWAVANQDAFQQVMDTYATKSMYLKNTMGALASTVLTALLPAFTSLVNIVIQGANWLNEFLAALSGQDTYLRAREVAVSYADALDEAAGNQKKLNQQLMAFDELNVITTPKSSGRDDDNNWVDAFERVDVSEKFTLVRTLGEKIRAVFDKLKEPFEKIKVYATNIKDIFAKIGVPASVEKIFDALKRSAESVFNFIKKVVDKLIEFKFPAKFSKDLGLIFDKFGTIFQKIANIQEKLDRLGITDAFASGLARVVTLFEQLTSTGILDGLTLIADALDVLDKLLSGDILGALDALKNQFLDLVASVLRPFAVLMDYAEKAISKILNKNSSEILTNFERMVNEWKGIYEPVAPAKSGGILPYAGYNELYDYDQPVMKFTGGGGGRSFELRANGGFPEMGSIFAAGEVPGEAEFVGNINGRTGVASGQEITGIADAVYATGNEEASLLRELVAVVKAGGGSMQPSAAFGRFASQSIRLYKGVTG